MHGAPSLTLSQGAARMTASGVAPSGVREGKFYSDSLGSEKRLTRFKLTINSKESQSSKIIKGLLKSKINPTKIKVGTTLSSHLKTGKC